MDGKQHAEAEGNKSGMALVTDVKHEPVCVDVGLFLPHVVNGSSLKRRRTEDYDIQMACSNKLGNLLVPDQRDYCVQGRSFLYIRHTLYVYQTEDWKPKGCTMYLPLGGDVLINMRSIEQISFEQDQFFLADDKGNYVGAKPGNAIHLWRLDKVTKKLFISRSILFIKDQEYNEIRSQLALM